MTADGIIAALGLAPHSEGGWYRETRVADGPGRPAGTAIHVLLRAGDGSRWHRVDPGETWHFYAGAALTPSVAATAEGPARDLTLGPDLAAGQRLQIVVPADHWQAARTTGDWTLAGCTVSPGFRFERFELAPKGFGICRSEGSGE